MANENWNRAGLGLFGAVYQDDAPSRNYAYGGVGNSNNDIDDYDAETIENGRTEITGKIEVDTDTSVSTHIAARFRVQSPFASNSDHYQIEIRGGVSSDVDTFTVNHYRTISTSQSTLLSESVDLPGSLDMTNYLEYRFTCETVSGDVVLTLDVKNSGKWEQLSTFTDSSGSKITAAGRSGFRIRSITADGKAHIDKVVIRKK